MVTGLAQAQMLAQSGTRAPLLPEGAFLTQVQGSLEPGEAGQPWKFRLRDAFEGEADRMLGLLPSVTLEDMIRRRDSMPSGAVAKFELSARVTIYHGGNLALPLFATPLAEFSARPPRPMLRPPGASAGAIAQSAALDDAYEPRTTKAVQENPFGSRWVPLLPQARAARDQALTTGGYLRADDIEQRLLEAVGDVQRSQDDTPQSVLAQQAARGDAVKTGSIDPLRNRPWLESDRSVQLRYGVVTRDPITGEWRFVFESSRNNLGEREATLLPCTVLERIERQARSMNEPLSIVLNGEVTRFQGRAYLLPISYSSPMTGKSLSR